MKSRSEHIERPAAEGRRFDFSRWKSILASSFGLYNKESDWSPIEDGITTVLRVNVSHQRPLATVCLQWGLLTWPDVALVVKSLDTPELSTASCLVDFLFSQLKKQKNKNWKCVCNVTLSLSLPGQGVFKRMCHYVNQIFGWCFKIPFHRFLLIFLLTYDLSIVSLYV